MGVITADPVANSPGLGVCWLVVEMEGGKPLLVVIKTLAEIQLRQPVRNPQACDA